jgi:hypothetical protein
MDVLDEEVKEFQRRLEGLVRGLLKELMVRDEFQ